MKFKDLFTTCWWNITQNGFILWLQWNYIFGKKKIEDTPVQLIKEIRKNILGFEAKLFNYLNYVIVNAAHKENIY